MDSQKLIEAIEKEYDKSLDTFFSYAWREKVDEFLDDESKYSRLVDWINEQIDLCKDNINIFNPADKIKQYSNGFFNIYSNACKNIAMLLNFKGIILDKRCTTKMREDIEYTICKVFNIHYSEQLKIYI